MNTRIPDSNTNHGGSFLMGLITGSAIATGLAIYLAPRLVRVVDRAMDAADDVTRRGRAVRDDVAEAVAHGAHEVGRGAREVVRGAREVEQFAQASKTDYRAS